VWELINARARVDGAQPELRHVCLACTELLSADGTAVSLHTNVGSLEPLFSTDPRTEEIEELQYTLGEGPSRDAAASDHPVLAPDLAATEAANRWPTFTPAARALGALAIFAFPTIVGATRVGVVTVHRAAPGSLTAGQLADGLVCADATWALVLGDQAGRHVNDNAYPGYIHLADRRMEVHQAAGMVSVQLRIHVTDALARLRAYAYVHDRRLVDVAADVLSRALRFEPDEADGDHWTPDEQTDPEQLT
jgi:hypothetical protein